MPCIVLLAVQPLAAQWDVPTLILTFQIVPCRAYQQLNGIAFKVNEISRLLRVGWLLWQKWLSVKSTILELSFQHNTFLLQDHVLDNLFARAFQICCYEVRWRCQKCNRECQRNMRSKLFSLGKHRLNSWWTSALQELTRKAVCCCDSSILRLICCCFL